MNDRLVAHKPMHVIAEALRDMGYSLMDWADRISVDTGKPIPTMAGFTICELVADLWLAQETGEALAVFHEPERERYRIQGGSGFVLTLFEAVFRYAHEHNVAVTDAVLAIVPNAERYRVART